MKLKALLITGLFCIQSTMAAGTVVFPASVTNLQQNQGEAISAVLAQTYGQIAKTQTLGLPDSKTALQTANGKAQEAATALGGTEYITMNVVALGSRILVEAIRWDAKSGTEVYRAQITTEGLDDIIEASDRLARALVTKTPVAETITLDNVTKEEERAKNRLFTETIKGIKIGGVYAFTTKQNDWNKDIKLDQMLSIGYNMKLDNRKFFIEFGAQALLPSDLFSSNNDTYQYGGVMFEMGGAYYLLDNPYLSAYLGIGASPRILISDAAGMGFVPYVDVGAIAMRVSKTRIYLNLRVGINALALNFDEKTEYDYDYSTYTSSDKIVRPAASSINPMEIGLQMGIGW